MHAICLPSIARTASFSRVIKRSHPVSLYDGTTIHTLACLNAFRVLVRDKSGSTRPSSNRNFVRRFLSVRATFWKKNSSRMSTEINLPQYRSTRSHARLRSITFNSTARDIERLFLFPGSIREALLLRGNHNFSCC